MQFGHHMLVVTMENIISFRHSGKAVLLDRAKLTLAASIYSTCFISMNSGFRNVTIDGNSH